MKKPIGQPKRPELRSRVDALLDSMIAKFYHTRNVGRLYVAYFMELHQELIVGQTDDQLLGKSLDMSVLVQVS